jgi:hypothetical protein
MNRGAVERALWGWAIASTLLRAALAPLPGTAGWALAQQRFLSPAFGWGSWLLLALIVAGALLASRTPRTTSAAGGAKSAAPAGHALGAVPPPAPAPPRTAPTLAPARPATAPSLTPAPPRLPSTTPPLAPTPPVVHLVLAALAGALLVLALPDRAWFLGDFLLRQGANGAGTFDRMFPQALPIDRLIHGLLAPALAHGDAGAANLFGRVLGALEAAALAVLALCFAHEIADAAARVPVALVVFFAGHLALLTGFAKASGELVVLTVLAAWLGVRCARHGRHTLAFGLTIALALATHRSAIALLPAAAVLAHLRLRAGAVRGAWRVFGPPALAALVLAPLLARIATKFDAGHHLPAALGGGAAPVGGGVWVLDRLSAIIVLAPLAPALLLAARPVVRTAWRDPAGRVLAALALGWVPLFLFVEPQQGLFRDWDVFAPFGATLALLSAWVLATSVRRKRSRLMLAAAAIAVVPTLQLLFMAHDVEAGLQRAHAFAEEAPIRPTFERARTWEYLGQRNDLLGRWKESRLGFENAARLAPTRRLFLSWALAATRDGDPPDAERAYRTLLGISPGDALGWLGLAGAATARGDSELAAVANDSLRAVIRRPGAGAEVQDYLRHRPEVWPAAAELVRRHDAGAAARPVR